GGRSRDAGFFLASALRSTPLQPPIVAPKTLGEPWVSRHGVRLRGKCRAPPADLTARNCSCATICALDGCFTDWLPFNADASLAALPRSSQPAAPATARPGSGSGTGASPR